MKIKHVLLILTAIACPLANLCFAQAPSLGTVSNYVLFTTTGAVGSTGISNITGNIGTNNGAITGFGPPTILVGVIDSGNALTVQASSDLAVAYNQLYNTAPTSTTHTPAFGGGETLFAGVYAIAAAGSIAGTLTLDAQGNSNAVFIFKFGGAFTTGALSTINLINGAMSCNIFWGAEGAIAMAAGTSISGTLISNNGAVSMGAGGVLNGRMLSTTGAVSVYGVTIPISDCAILPVDLLSFTAACDNQRAVLNWSTTAETNNNYFTAERSSDGIQWQIAGTVTAIRNPATIQGYSFTDTKPCPAISYYRLKQTDFNGNYKYGNIVYIEKCAAIATTEDLTVYQNQSAGILELLFSGDRNKIYSTEIFNSSGQKVYRSNGLQSKINFSVAKAGIYFVKINLYSKSITTSVFWKNN